MWLKLKGAKKAEKKLFEAGTLGWFPAPKISKSQTNLKNASTFREWCQKAAFDEFSRTVADNRKYTYSTVFDFSGTSKIAFRNCDWVLFSSNWPVANKSVDFSQGKQSKHENLLTVKDKTWSKMIGWKWRMIQILLTGLKTGEFSTWISP